MKRFKSHIIDENLKDFEEDVLADNKETVETPESKKENKEEKNENI
jgi:hypothetical protein|tara:strand:- start:2040 stop:2177 length:138 start_codon:yes stop_codon:yes gene_type:complete